MPRFSLHVAAPSILIDGAVRIKKNNKRIKNPNIYGFYNENLKSFKASRKTPEILLTLFLKASLQVNKNSEQQNRRKPYRMNNRLHPSV